MIITAYKTKKVIPGDQLFTILDRYFPKLEEKSVVVITSKIVSICQGDVIKNDGTVDKRELIKKEADWYFEDKNLDRFGVLIPTIKDDIFIANAGIDESNANGYFILWPKHLQETTNNIWKYLKEKHQIKQLGVLITDSRLVPLRWGLRGVGISWCGFRSIKNYINTPDIFGRPLKMSQESIVDSFSAAANVIMGEGNEQQPLAVISDVHFVEFQNRPPAKEELAAVRVSKEEDIYGKFLTSVKWEKGGKKKNE